MVKFDSLDTLDTTKYEWNIKVRVIRIWDSYSTKGEKEFKGRNLLLLDDKVLTYRPLCYLFKISEQCKIHKLIYLVFCNTIVTA